MSFSFCLCGNYLSLFMRSFLKHLSAMTHRFIYDYSSSFEFWVWRAVSSGPLAASSMVDLHFLHHLRRHIQLRFILRMLWLVINSSTNFYWIWDSGLRSFRFNCPQSLSLKTWQHASHPTLHRNSEGPFHFGICTHSDPITSILPLSF